MPGIATGIGVLVYYFVGLFFLLILAYLVYRWIEYLVGK